MHTIKHTCCECGADKHESEGDWLKEQVKWLCHGCFINPLVVIPEEEDIVDG